MCVHMNESSLPHAAHTLTPHSVEYTSGVVVDVGHGVATCCAVWEGEECPGSTSCDPLECTAPTAAKMVHALLAACSKETRAVLQERVVVTGKTFYMYMYMYMYMTCTYVTYVFTFNV